MTNNNVRIANLTVVLHFNGITTVKFCAHSDEEITMPVFNCHVFQAVKQEIVLSF